MPRPLDGIKVLDFTWGLNGPCAGVWLSDLGAEVTKVEPRAGEFSRSLLPVPNCNFTPYFVCGARGKRDITLDITKPEGTEIVLKMAERSDVLISNYRGGSLEKAGLGYEEVKKHNATIIYATSNTFGSKGPLANARGNDWVAQAYGGVISVTGYEDEALRAGPSIADLGGTFSLVLGVMTALLVRERFGIGQRVDASLYGGQIMLQTWEIDHYTMLGKLPKPLRRGRHHNLLPPTSGLQKTKDGFVMIAGIRPDAWPSYCQKLGFPEIANDPRFSDFSKRLENFDELTPYLEEAFKKKTTQEWFDILGSLDIMLGKVQNYEDIVNDPQAIENGYIIEMDLPGLGPTKLVGVPMMLSETPAKAQGLPPELGQHTEEVLLELGYSWDDISRLTDEGVVGNET